MPSVFHEKSAFSLVELSIVLVILGLLVGGILTGQSLIRAAELRAVTTELQSHRVAITTFRDKYFYYPGDLPNATDFWGAAQAGGGCDTSTAGTGTETCNGDGDGQLDHAADADEYGEEFTIWQHLANAGLIEGTYTGRAGPAGDNDSVIGTNSPQSRMSNAGWSTYVGATSGAAHLFDTTITDSLAFGSEVSGNKLVGAVLTPEEAWNIDKKMDDGMPGTGKIHAVHWDDCTDATASSMVTASYLLSDTSTVCALQFMGLAK